MKCKTLEIRWHDRMPIYSTNIHCAPPTAHKKAHNPYSATGVDSAVALSREEDKAREEREKDRTEREKCWRVATCGADGHIRLWLLHPRPLPSSSSSTSAAPAPAKPSTGKQPATAASDDPRVEYLATLTKHEGPVNCVRFAPKGEMLASAGDDGNILIWVPGESVRSIGETADEKAYEKEGWRVRNMIRSMTGKEIYDLAWSPEGDKILAGSVDHSATVYDVATGSPLCKIADHGSYVQGVAWDPLEEFIATQSSDRSMHVYSYADAPTGMAIHSVGKNSRMFLQTRKPDSSSSSSSAGTLKAPKPSHSAADKELERPPISRSLSRASDSDRSEASSTAPSSLVSTGTVSKPTSDEPTTAMNPPSGIPHHPHQSLHHRRSSTSGSQPSKSPSLTPTTALGGGSGSSAPARPLRSPSPAPLPAVMVPVSPRLNPVASSSTTTSTGGAPGPNYNESVSNDAAAVVKMRLYGDPMASQFFRRLGFSPDGGLLVSPTGVWEGDAALAAAAAAGSGAASGAKKGKKAVGEGDDDTAPGSKPTVFLYARGNLAGDPIARLPGHKTASVAVSFCPVLWELRGAGSGEADEPTKEVVVGEGAAVDVPLSSAEAKGKGKAVDAAAEGDEVTARGRPRSAGLFDLPYRMVYAVATHDAVYVYDTQQQSPIAMFSGLHWKAYTDLSWSPDGLTLFLSSLDGYCSVVAFEPGELGTPYHTQRPRRHRSRSRSHSRSAHPAPHSSPVKPAGDGGALPALFAKAAETSSTPAKPSASTAAEIDLSQSSPAVLEKRPAAAEGADGAADTPAKKKAKRVQPTLLKPL
ncbi:hypothetical protein JCM10207_005435 [Rhodosporidiobolus poonsookiae]